MKKLLLGITMAALSTTAIAQDAAGKKYQAGLVAGFGLNFQEMGTTRMASLGAGTDFTVGANVNIGFTETIGLTTGAEFDFSRVRYAAGADQVYYYYNDKDILQNNESTPTSNLFQLIERRERPVYLSIPTMLMFRTNFIGYFRYFGKFGLRNSILLSYSTNDTGNLLDPNLPTGTPTPVVQENMTSNGQNVPFKSAVGASGGAEWNFTGSTCLMAEIGFYYGFTPLYRDRPVENSTLHFYDGNGTANWFSNQARQTQLMFKVSILF